MIPPRIVSSTFVLCVLVAVVSPAPAAALVVDFEALNPGDGVPQLNAFFSLHGIPIAIDAFLPGTLVVVSANNNKYVQVTTHPSGADVLLNFGVGIRSAQVDFLPFPTQGIVEIDAFSANVTPSTVTGNPFFLGATKPNLPPPLTLSFSTSTPIVRAIQLEESANLLQFDNLVVRELSGSPIPEPATLALLGGGAAGLVARGRRRRAH